MCGSRRDKAFKPLIGILGGMGPSAGIDLANRLMLHTPAASDQGHIPFVLLSQPADIPDRSAFLLGYGEVNPAAAIADKLLLLEQAGVTLAAIPCNTAHAPVIFDEVMRVLRSSGSRLHVVHLILTVVEHVKKNYVGNRVGVASTLGTWHTGLYSRAFEFNDIGFVPMSKHWAIRVHEAIYHPIYGIKSHIGSVPSQVRKTIFSAFDELIAAGATCIIKGCTELPIAITEESYRGVPLLNPNDLLAIELIKYL